MQLDAVAHRDHHLAAVVVERRAHRRELGRRLARQRRILRRGEPSAQKDSRIEQARANCMIIGAEDRLVSILSPLRRTRPGVRGRLRSLLSVLPAEVGCRLGAAELRTPSTLVRARRNRRISTNCRARGA